MIIHPLSFTFIVNKVPLLELERLVFFFLLIFLYSVHFTLYNEQSRPDEFSSNSWFHYISLLINYLLKPQKLIWRCDRVCIKNKSQDGRMIFAKFFSESWKLKIRNVRLMFIENEERADRQTSAHWYRSCIFRAERPQKGRPTFA